MPKLHHGLFYGSQQLTTGEAETEGMPLRSEPTLQNIAQSQEEQFILSVCDTILILI